MFDVKIESDGLSKNTKVFHSDGSQIHGVRKITWSAEGGRSGGYVARAILEMSIIPASVKGEARCIAAHPETGEYIEIAGYLLPDGTTLRIDGAAGAAHQSQAKATEVEPGNAGDSDPRETQQRPGSVASRPSRGGGSPAPIGEDAPE